MMVGVLLSSFILFPPDDQTNIYWATVRLFIAAAIPVHVVQYWFLRHGGLETMQSRFIGSIALTVDMYGFLVL